MMTADIEKKKEYLEYYKTVFPKRITDNITLDIDSNGDFYPDYYWLLENMLTFHKMAMKICEPSTEFEFGWYFKYYLDFLREILERKSSFLIINIPPGHGKCFGKGTLIRMYDGSTKKIEEIRSGEKVMGDDNTPRTVLSTTTGKEEMYKITCQDGTSFICNGSHILVLHNIKDKKEELITVFEYIKKDKNYKKEYKIVKSSVEYKERKLKTSPFILGRFFGYGNSVHNDIIKGIPEEFLKNSKQNRLEFLRGLLDGDPTSKMYKNRLRFTSKSETFVKDIAELCRSLGFYVQEYKELVGKDIYYKLRVIGNTQYISFFKRILTAKINKEKQINPLLQHFIVESLGVGDYYGFELDGNHKFLLDNFTVSHNSSTLMSFVTLFLGFFPHTRFFITSGTQDVREKYRNYTKAIIESEYYKQLFPGVEIDPDKPDNKNGFSIKRFDYNGQTEGGGYINIKPLLANMTGLDADFIIFDDPVDYKRYKIEKEQYIQTTNSGVGSSITRERGTIKKPTPFILCMQRICENDPTGFLMTTKSYPKWKHIRIPIRIENGEDSYYDQSSNNYVHGKYFISPYRKWFVKNGDYIFPERFNNEKFELNRDLMNNDIDFEWQVFQDCKQEDSKIFHLSCINRYDSEQIKDIDFKARILSIDSSEGDNDYQSMQFLGFLTYNNNITKRKELNSYLLEAYLSQEKTPIFINKIIDWYLEYQPDYILVEEKSSGYEIINALEILIYGGLLDKKDPRKNKKVIGISPKLSKVDRAISASVEINNSRVFFPKEYTKIAKLDKKQVFILKEIERELDVFPSPNDKVHDDGVDVLTQGINWARMFFNKNKERRINISYV